MADFPFVPGAADLLARLAASLDAEGKIPRALETLGPLAGRDVVLACWSAFRGPSPTEVAEADRVLRPEGRLLVVHDYGRDDVSRLRGDLPEYGSWGRRDGWFLKHGFKMRVIHCFWTFDSMDDATAFLVEAFGETGTVVAARLKRPRLSYNVAVYHRPRGGAAATA